MSGRGELGAGSAGYVELQAATHYSFLRGASSPEELFAAAALLGLPAPGVADRASLAGAVKAHEAGKVTGVRALVGCRLDLRDGTALLVYPTDLPAYSRLTRLLTVGKARAGKGECDLAWEDVVEHGAGQIAILAEPRPSEALRLRLERLRAEFGDRAYLALTRRLTHVIASRIVDLSDALRRIGLGGGGAVCLPHGRGDEVRGGGGPDQRGHTVVPRAKEDYNPDLRITDEPGIKVTSRNFR